MSAFAHAEIPVWMTVDEFLAWEPGDGLVWQLVDGVPRAMAPANRTHGTLQAELARLIGNHLVDTGRPCVVVTEPGVVPHVNASRNFRIPELAVSCTGYEAEETAVSDPVLIVEILSPSNQSETWANVWAYTTIPSVQEIVVVRTVSIGAELLRRGADGGWPREPEAVLEGELVFESIGLRTSLVDLYWGTRLRLVD